METIQLVQEEEVCKRCGSKNVRKDVMPENGIEYPILVCQEQRCGWWA